RLDLGVLGDVGLAGRGDALLLLDQVDRLLRRGEIAIDAEHPCAFAREGDCGGPPIADAFAGTLTRADDDGDLVFQTHLSSLRELGTAAGLPCNEARCRSSWWRARAPRHCRRR